MAIRTVVTRGYGNGTFNGTIPLVVTRGYLAGAALPEPEPEPTPTPTPAAPDRGFDQFMEAFARERAMQRRLRENDEIMRIAALEDEFILNLLRKLI